MVARSTNRGHKMYFDEADQLWKYEDDSNPVRDFWHGKPCGVCLKHKTAEGHDPCLGTLANVENACCGHGDVNAAYVIFTDGQRVAGDKASEFFDAATFR